MKYKTFDQLIKWRNKILLGKDKYYPQDLRTAAVNIIKKSPVEEKLGIPRSLKKQILDKGWWGSRVRKNKRKFIKTVLEKYDEKYFGEQAGRS